ncbi:MAG: hypothetical protein KME22_07495 [Hassallia sp. WJT32-NPBG1]|nr:hypothetical protein [Hassallia sp. WJT32-NPBG1]
MRQLTVMAQLHLIRYDDINLFPMTNNLSLYNMKEKAAKVNVSRLQCGVRNLTIYHHKASYE